MSKQTGKAPPHPTRTRMGSDARVFAAVTCGGRRICRTCANLEIRTITEARESNSMECRSPSTRACVGQETQTSDPRQFFWTPRPFGKTFRYVRVKMCVELLVGACMSRRMDARAGRRALD